MHGYARIELYCYIVSFRFFSFLGCIVFLLRFRFMHFPCVTLRHTYTGFIIRNDRRMEKQTRLRMHSAIKAAAATTTTHFHKIPFIGSESPHPSEKERKREILLLHQIYINTNIPFRRMHTHTHTMLNKWKSTTKKFGSTWAKLSQIILSFDINYRLQLPFAVLNGQCGHRTL